MAVAFDNATSVAEATSVNVTYTAPTGIADGDLLLIWHTEWKSGSAPPVASPPTGVAAVPGTTFPIHQVGAATGNMDTWLWYKIAASESGNYVVTRTSSVRRGIMALVKGNHTTTPFEVNPTTNKGNASPAGGGTTFLGIAPTV